MSEFLTMEEFLGMNTQAEEKGDWEWKRNKVKLPIRSVPGDVYYKSRKSAIKVSVTGKKSKAERKVDFDDLRYKAEIIIAGIDTDRTNFRIDSQQVLAKFDKVAAVDVVPCMFRPNEIDSLYDAIAAISDFAEDEEAEEEVKNS
ncbi:phage tail assembly chaperone [Brevibacillus sp. NRS-1366]|uniref:phage tail assembly chaperone n=1 Tax=Brevibacillus sp. NRS-1366 TaxID=3233899 RepID=UPI003D20EE6A